MVLFLFGRFSLMWLLGESANAIKIQIHRKSPADTLMDLLRTGDNGPDNVNVLCGFLQPVQPSGKGLGGHTESRIGRTDTVGTFHIEG